MNYTHDAASYSDVFFARTLISSASSLPDDGYAIQIWPAPKVTSNWNNLSGSPIALYLFGY